MVVMQQKSDNGAQEVENNKGDVRVLQKEVEEEKGKGDKLMI